LKKKIILSFCFEGKTVEGKAGREGRRRGQNPALKKMRETKGTGHERERAERARMEVKHPNACKKKLHSKRRNGIRIRPIFRCREVPVKPGGCWREKKEKGNGPGTGKNREHILGREGGRSPTNKKNMGGGAPYGKKGGSS